MRGRSRRVLARRKRGELDGDAPGEELHGDGAGWDHTLAPVRETRPARGPTLPLRARLLAIFSDPRVESVTIDGAARLLSSPRQDVEATLDAMVQAGEAFVREGAVRAYGLPPEHKARLEATFRDTAQELGEHGVLMRVDPDQALATLDDETEEPRLPVTAGLLSLFLPGTGQLLNGDVGRASLVFAVWSLAWITHLSPVWTFVCLYAGAEAFFTAKIRSMERKLAREAAQAPPQALPPSPSES